MTIRFFKNPSVWDSGGERVEDKLGTGSIPSLEFRSSMGAVHWMAEKWASLSGQIRSVAAG